MAVREMMRQSLQVIHVFGEVFGDVRLQDFEDAALTPPTLGIAPREAQHRAHARLGEDFAFDTNIVGLHPFTKIALNDLADFFRFYIANPVFQTRQRIAKRRPEVLVACDNLPQFLQSGNFCDQAKQPRFR